ncbi:MAG TPA: hypothetical protein PLU30_04560 [Verrucomicrobiae bacterium]|nr:hypothetical protein [Verrucomicrobiae bacterium]
MRNITLSADERLIDEARRQAAFENRSLNDLFRDWLRQYTAAGGAAADFDGMMGRLDARGIRAGRKFTRGEMNERR